ncbi:hypothetical protein ONZ45_g19626 [Pleurotus djamor]|nr:hypothetical protein ONZ45_g19626 [Pleurotus djamor]
MPFLPNFGRVEGVPRAVGLNGYPDKVVGPLKVFLVVKPVQGMSVKTDASYWSIAWDVGFTASKSWANWGMESWALTEGDLAHLVPIEIKALTYAERQRLESIIDHQQVQSPGHPQVWCRDVLASFSGDDPFDWNNSEPIGLSNGVNPGSRILKVPSLDRRLFKFTKVESFPPSFSIEPFGGFGLAVGLLANGTLALVKTEGAEKYVRNILSGLTP